MKINIYTDPGHGWLDVPRSLLHELGIAERVSSYSYQRGDSVFLEEDCDYSLFRRAMMQAGREFTTADIHTDQDSFIRSLPRYEAAQLQEG